MSTAVSTVLFPRLDSMMMNDWLPKIGEKAFMAWLRLHSWKDPSASSASFVLPLSINRIIKRLKVGNSTFYDHILRPLWNYGLIDIIKAGPNKKEQHLVLHTYPCNDPAKSSAPLLQIRDYDLDPPKGDAPIPADVADRPEDSPSPTLREQETETPAPLPPIPLVICETPAPDSIQGDSKQASDDGSSLSLPYSVQKAIEKHPEWQKRAESIQLVYARCKDHPDYDEEQFLQKIHTCMRYPHDPKRFASYLLKSLVNEWNKRKAPYPNRDHPSVQLATAELPASASYPFRKPESAFYRKTDVPEWVRRQQEHPPSHEPQELTPEQQAEINRLLKALGEI